MSVPLPRSAPVEQEVDPRALLAFVDAVEDEPHIELHSLMVLRHGHVIAEGWWAPHTPERTRLLYSLSKSFTSAALGFALQERLLDLDDTLVSHFPEFAEEITSPRSRAITVRHVASMASGHNREMMNEAYLRDPEEPVRGLLLIPPDEDPGALFAYSQPCTYALASVVQRAAGMPLTEYLRPRLLDPLGIGEVAWMEWPPGRELGFIGLFGRTEDVAKLGQLFLRRGRWGDGQLLAPSYVDEATTLKVDTPSQDNVDWRQGYGYQFWMSRHGYRGDGAFGQFCLVLPDQDAVIAMTGGTEAMQAVLDNVWRHVLPGFASARPDDGAQRELDARLRDLAVPAYAAHPSPPRWDDWTDEAFAVASDPQGPTATTVASVRMARAADGLIVTLSEDANALSLPVGAGRWTVSAPLDQHGDPIPVATSGGWLDEETARIEVIFLETPHRMAIECRLRPRAAQAAWRHLPLDGGMLRTLHRPT